MASLFNGPDEKVYRQLYFSLIKINDRTLLFAKKKKSVAVIKQGKLYNH